MNTTICDAISKLALLSFSYRGYPRVVEPHALGRNAAGHDVLRCYQVRGGSDSGEPVGWKLMTVDEISGLEILNEYFSGPRSGYRIGDKAMRIIHCQL